ncbi:MAG: hypothetical protein LBS50_05665 [Prevotellaceae bacterium]|jgi:hypothetical protein|nr:hypothetical protein [Prevotellaceae bacterium]
MATLNNKLNIAKQQSDELLKLILQKTGTSRSSIVRLAEQQFILANLDVITPAERKRFNQLVF